MFKNPETGGSAPEQGNPTPFTLFTLFTVESPAPSGAPRNARICLARGGVLECRLPFSTHSETGADPATGRAAYPAA